MRVCLVVLCLVIAGCSSGPSRPNTYKNLGWARVSASQAEAECYDYLASANGRMSSLYVCMKGKGWEQQ